MESAGLLMTIVTPLVAVPLTMITFYLRSLREHQVSAQAETARRLDALEASIERMQETFAAFERDYTTKEEWLREAVWARRALEQLRESTVRMETLLQRRDAAGRDERGGDD